MSTSITRGARVLSGMRPTGRLHLGHYHGVLKNWVRLQQEHECFFFVADWHALTTAYDEREIIAPNVWDLVIDWLACGVNPKLARVFIQSRVMEHAELNLLLSMIAPLGWLERVPTFKDQIQNLREKDIATHGFLGYPVLQSADILIYTGITRAKKICVLVGTKKALAFAIRNMSVLKRNTKLKERLNPTSASEQSHPIKEYTVSEPAYGMVAEETMEYGKKQS